MNSISKICIPYTAGCGSAAIVSSEFCHTLCSRYIMSGTFSTLCVAFIALAIFSRRCRRVTALWISIFFFAGAAGYGNNSVVSMTRPPAVFFAPLAEKLHRTINSIPFEDCRDNSLLLALISGDRSKLDRNTVNDFRTAGAAHLLALSGMHLGVLYILISKLLSIAGSTVAKRKIRSLAIISTTGLYTLLCGAGASLVRAWLFIFLAESARLLHRPQPAGQIFCTALTLHLIFSPSSITEPGFQLSYLAMIGIVFLWPHIRNWMKSRIWDGASLCISCQLFTGPLSYAYFGTFPKFFLLTNLIAAPLMTLVLVFGIAAIIFNGIGAECHWLFTVCELPLKCLRYLIGAIAGLGSME